MLEFSLKTYVFQQFYIVRQVVELRQIDLELGNGLVIFLHAVNYYLHILQPGTNKITPVNPVNIKDDLRKRGRVM